MPLPRPALLAPLLAASIVLATGCSTTSRLASKTSRLASKTYHVFAGKPRPAAPGEATKRTSKLALKMQLKPVPVRLSDTRQIEVIVRLENISKKFIQLEFPTSQRIDIVVQDETGKQISRMSDDHILDNTPSYVGINPGEHVEYTNSVSTRDMQPGKSYTVRSFFPSFPELEASEVLIPEK